MRKAWLDHIGYDVKKRKRKRKKRKRKRKVDPDLILEFQAMCCMHGEREKGYNKKGFVVIGYKPPSDWLKTIPPWQWSNQA